SWNRSIHRSDPSAFFRTFESINRTWRPWTRGVTIWPVLLCAVLFAGIGGEPASAVAFPANKFPVQLVDRNAFRFVVSGGEPQRVFSSDQWSDYLIFRFYPKVHVYFDGRSDFFGPWRGTTYQHLMGGGPDASTILAR